MFVFFLFASLALFLEFFFGILRISFGTMAPLLSRNCSLINDGDDNNSKISYPVILSEILSRILSRILSGILSGDSREISLQISRDSCRISSRILFGILFEFLLGHPQADQLRFPQDLFGILLKTASRILLEILRHCRNEMLPIV